MPEIVKFESAYQLLLQLFTKCIKKHKTTLPDQISAPFPNLSRTDGTIPYTVHITIEFPAYCARAPKPHYFTL